MPQKKTMGCLHQQALFKEPEELDANGPTHRDDLVFGRVMVIFWGKQLRYVEMPLWE